LPTICSHETLPVRADREYLEILYLAAQEALLFLPRTERGRSPFR